MIADRVIAILAAQAQSDPASITADMGLDALGLDSLGLVEAIFAIEETFAIAIPVVPDDTGLVTVGDLITQVSRLTK